LVVKIDEKSQVSQPNALGRGQTAVTPASQIDVAEEGNKVTLFRPGASLSSLVDALNKLGTSPSDLVAILEALKQAGALKAEMVVI
jgi:flagellar P-ring protein precursor FlgI